MLCQIEQSQDLSSNPSRSMLHAACSMLHVMRDSLPRPPWSVFDAAWHTVDLDVPEGVPREVPRRCHGVRHMSVALWLNRKAAADS